MNASELAIVRDWLQKSAGAMTQDQIADAIVAAGFKMDRTRYGRYATGRLPIGPKVYANLVTFWKGRGITAPDLNPPAAAEPPVDPVVAAIEAQTKVIERLADQIEALVASRDKDLASLALTVGQALRDRVILDRTPAA